MGTFHKTQQCPACGYTIDMASPIKGSQLERPEPGTPTVCFNCVELLRFDDHMRLYKPTFKQLEDLDSDTLIEIESARAKLRIFKRMLAAEKEKKGLAKKQALPSR